MYNRKINLLKKQGFILLIPLITFSFTQNERGFNMSESEKKELIQTVENLMHISQIQTRDTWKGLEGFNYDDFFANNRSYNGKKQLQIVIKEDGFTDTKGKRYSIPGFKNLAYDSYEIRVPKRLIGMRHNIVHELVHFLQENSDVEDTNYIQFNGNNYLEYVSQKSEFEAHFIQLLYIKKYELEKIKLNEDDLKEFVEKAEMSIQNQKVRLYFILFSKSHGII